jgi:hypothetical protein
MYEEIQEILDNYIDNPEAPEQDKKVTEMLQLIILTPTEVSKFIYLSLSISDTM